MATEGDLELLAQEQVLGEDALAAAQGVDELARRSPRSSIIGPGSPIAAASRGWEQAFAPYNLDRGRGQDGIRSSRYVRPLHHGAQSGTRM